MAGISNVLNRDVERLGISRDWDYDLGIRGSHSSQYVFECTTRRQKIGMEMPTRMIAMKEGEFLLHASTIQRSGSVGENDTC